MNTLSFKLIKCENVLTRQNRLNKALNLHVSFIKHSMYTVSDNKIIVEYFAGKIFHWDQDLKNKGCGYIYTYIGYLYVIYTYVEYIHLKFRCYH